MAQHGEPVAGHVPECFGHAFQLGFFQVWINIFPCYCEDTLFLRELRAFGQADKPVPVLRRIVGGDDGSGDSEFPDNVIFQCLGTPLRQVNIVFINPFG